MALYGARMRVFNNNTITEVEWNYIEDKWDRPVTENLVHATLLADGRIQVLVHPVSWNADTNPFTTPPESVEVELLTDPWVRLTVTTTDTVENVLAGFKSHLQI
jgi:hypothetical protein